MKCTSCGGAIQKQYMPMKEWDITGPLCGTCYSARLSEYYPGEHVRMD